MKWISRCGVPGGLLCLLWIWGQTPTFGAVTRVDEGLFTEESEHFIFIVEESLLSELPGFMKDCEDAYRILTPLFNWHPRCKVVAVYSDARDVHNGWTIERPRPTMLVYAADSPTSSEIYEPGNYRRRTVFHEFAHALQLDARHGIDGAFIDLFGRVWPQEVDPLSLLFVILTSTPGELAPRWYLEGLSIWAETEFVGPGRGRNAIADMMFRMAFLDDRMVSARQWHTALPEWPYGRAAYLYGMKTIEHAQLACAVEPGEDRNVPGELSDSVSRSFTWFFDRRSKQATGRTFGQLAAEAMDREKARQKERVEKLCSVALTDVPRLTPRRLGVSHPAFGADGLVYFAGSREADRSRLMVCDTKTDRVRELPGRVTDDFSELAVSPDGRFLYFTRLDIVGRRQLRSYLYCYDIRLHRTRLLSRRGRYLHPAVSPDGALLAAVRQEAGRQVLLEVPVTATGDRSAERVLATAPAGHSMVDPVYTPDGRAVVYVLANKDGSKLLRVPRAEGGRETLVDWPGIITGPAFSPDGSRLVFASDRSGVYNLYALAEGADEPVAVTHVVGGLFDPVFSPDGKTLAAVGYDSYGFYLTVFPTSSLRPVGGELPVLDPPWKPLPSNAARVAAVAAGPPPDASSVHPSPYHSLGNMRFDYWNPWADIGEDDVEIGLGTAFSDLALEQELILRGGVATEFGDPVGDLSYTYSGWYPEFHVHADYGRVTYSYLLRDKDDLFFDYDENVLRAGAYVTFPLDRVDWQTSLSVGYQFSNREVIEDSAEDYAGHELVTANPYEGTEGTLWANWHFNNGTSFPRSHSVEDGRYLSATVERSDEGLGGELARTRARGDWVEYVTTPWAENHVLRLQGVYAMSSGDEVAQGAFGMGGYGDDLLSGSTPSLDPTIVLRGYDTNYQVGNKAAKASIAYRFPLLNVYARPNATSPLYFRQLFGEVFYETGRAWGQEPVGQAANDWLNSFGIEVNASMTLLRLLTVAPGIGVAVVPDRDARRRGDEDDNSTDDDPVQVYFTLKAGVSY